MKVWITKYALTKGIFEANVNIVPSGYNTKIKYASCKGLFTRDWVKTREEAVEKAKEMRTKRIASLKKLITKLEHMEL